MKAWVKRGAALQLQEVSRPAAASNELLVRVAACSLNRGEIRAVQRAADGALPGWRVAGAVIAAAANGKGPKAGARVCALVNSGGWGEVVAVPASHAAVVPDGVELDVAATLPIAGLTVVRALGVAGSLVGKRMLITGASGGVGQFAIQLGAMAGAAVTAVRDLVASTEDGPYDFILESVGGPSFAAAIERVARGGVVVTIGNPAEQETTFNARTLYAKGGASIYGLLIFEELDSLRVTAADLERLLRLVDSGKLQSPIAMRRPWKELPEALHELEQRSFRGKAVVVH